MKIYMFCLISSISQSCHILPYYISYREAFSISSVVITTSIHVIFLFHISFSILAAFWLLWLDVFTMAIIFSPLMGDILLHSDNYCFFFYKHIGIAYLFTNRKYNFIYCFFCFAKIVPLYIFFLFTGLCHYNL